LARSLSIDPGPGGAPPSQRHPHRQVLPSPLEGRAAQALPRPHRDEPEKNWKFSRADVEEWKFWKHYMTAYEECVSATSTTDVPWYVVPADDKDNARLIVSQIILDTLERLDMHYPKTTPERHQELLSIREQLAS
jgi:hypothetical protein